MAISREEIPESVFAALETVRQSGETNMLSKTGVIDSMMTRELWSAVDWLLDHKADYGTVVMIHFSDWLVEKKGE